MIVLKLGGRVLQQALSDGLLFAELKSSGLPCVLVHGGGAEITDTAKALGIESRFSGGQRVTDEALMKVVEMVLRGRMNTQMVLGLQRAGMRAVGVSGADDALLRCEIEDPALGLVGRVSEVRAQILYALLEKAFVPVVAPLGVLPDGRSCNVNADVAAAALARSLGAEQLIFLTDQEGLLDAAGRCWARLSLAELEKIQSGSTVSGGMAVKARSVSAFLKGAPKNSVVRIVSGLDPALFSRALRGEDAGTRIGS